MTRDPARRHRRSIRLQRYDYSQAGAYFITICTQDRACLFGEVVDGDMRLNDAGRMTERWWLELDRKFRWVETDEYVVMPNHFHGVIVFGEGADVVGTRAGHGVGAGLCVCPDRTGANRGADADHGAHTGAPWSTVGDLMVQPDDDERIHTGRQGAGVAGVSGSGLATQLLRTRRPRRRILKSHQGIHRQQPSALGVRPGNPGWSVDRPGDHAER